MCDDSRVPDFVGENLSRSRFDEVYLTNASWIDNLLVNGVGVVLLVQAERDRRAKMRLADARGFREAWAIHQRLWQQTVDRARGMAPELLHERVDAEWSFIETPRCAAVWAPS